jgi:hypothetical protein
MPILGLDARGITPELKLRPKFCCSWTWCFYWVFFFFFSCFCLFVILLWVFNFNFYFYFLFFFLYYQLHHHYLLIPILNPLTLPPSPVLQSTVLLPNDSSAPSHPLSPLPLPPPPILPQPVTTLPFPPTHSPVADKPTIPTLHNPKPLQSLTQAP